MKHTTFFILTALLLLVAVPELAFSQFTSLNPQGQVFGYRYPVVTDRSYAQNTTDTLPNASINNWFAASPQSFNVGAVDFLSMRFINADSCYAYIYVDELQGATWTNAVYTDSVEVNNSDTTEIVLRAPATDRLSGRIGSRYRVRVNFQNVTQGTSSATWSLDWLWKP